MSQSSGVNQSNTKPVNQGYNDEIDLRHLIGMLLDGRYIIAITLAVVATLALVYVLVATPIYKANGIILVEDNAPGLPGLDDMAEIFATESSSATELHVIKSRLVLGRVVDELGLTIEAAPAYVPLIGEMLARGTPTGRLNGTPFGLSGYAGGGETIKVAELVLPNYLNNQQLTLIAEGDNKYSLWFENTKLLEGAVGESLLTDQFDIKVTELVAHKGAEFTLSKAGRLSKILDLQRKLQVSEKGKDTGIIEISLEGADPQRIAQIVDSVSANYYLQNVQRMAAEAENSLRFLDEQIPLIQEQLISSEEALNDYRSERTSVDLSLEAQSALDSLVQIEADISTMSINEAEISRRFTPQHPNYISFKRQQRNLLNQRNKLSRKLEALPDTQKKILRLKRDFEVNQAIFVALKNKRQELSILKASTVGNVRILDRAEVMPNTVAPKRGLIMVLALLLGGMLGVIIVAVRHFLRAGVSDPKVFADNGLMVHATIPHSENEDSYKEQTEFLKRYKERKKAKANNKPQQLLLANDHPADLAIEALRSLRTSLHFAMLDASNHVVMMSSASPGVGKSFVSSNLGAVIAQTGQRVLVVDADMRKGYLHKRFGLSPEQGLSDVLAGTLEAKQAVRSTVIDTLDLMTRGNIPSNPSELLMSAQFPAMITELEAEYDLILFDTPPILAVTDASIVGAYCGTSLMVARFESCTLKEVLAANHRFDLGGVDIKGIVFNAVEKKASSYYYDYGYYNYEYKPED